MAVIKTRYITSEFLGKAAASDVLAKFHSCLTGCLDKNNLLQVSMDGPNVNLLLFSIP